MCTHDTVLDLFWIFELTQGGRFFVMFFIVALLAISRVGSTPLAASFIVTVGLDNLTTAYNDSGVAFASYNASDIISRAIAALPYPSGGTVLLRAGAYFLDSPISIERCSVTLRGESKGGDLYFNSDGTYHGYRNKSAVTLIAPASDAIAIGTTLLALGITVENVLITGAVDGDGLLPRAYTTPGAGIRAERVDTFQVGLKAPPHYHPLHPQREDKPLTTNANLAPFCCGSCPR